MRPVIITLTGPTCSGKSTLAQKLTSAWDVPEIRSFTTRAPRSGEVDGVHYDFVSHDQARQWLQEGSLVQFVQLNDNIYGSTFDQVREALRHGVCSIVVEPTGVLQFRKAAERLDATVFAVYIDNPLPRLLRRYLERSKGDACTPVVTHAKRMIAIIEVESKRWADMVDYDMVLDGLDDEDTEANSLDFAARFIVEHATQRRALAA